jgi:hypothetical protein
MKNGNSAQVTVPERKKCSDPRNMQILHYTGSSTTYQTRQFFNNFTTNEDIAQQLAALLTHCSSFLTYERHPVQISLQYLHWFWNY